MTSSCAERRRGRFNSTRLKWRRYVLLFVSLPLAASYSAECIITVNWAMRDLIFDTGFTVYSRGQNKNFICVILHFALRGTDWVRPVTSCTKNLGHTCPSVRPVCADRLEATAVTRREAGISHSIRCLLDDRSLIANRVRCVQTFCRAHAAFYPVRAARPSRGGGGWIDMYSAEVKNVWR
jgi:hypothetical protein